MTDFFADLEQEIRAAHPRRARPVAPVRGIAATAAVAVTLGAVVLGIGALSPTAEQVANQPTPEPQPTAVVPADCNGKVVDGRIPDEIVDRFAILRGDGETADLPSKRIPFEAAAVVRQSLRLVEGPGGARYVVAVVQMAQADCDPSDYGVCLISLTTENVACVSPGDGPPLNSLVDELPDGRRVLAIIGEDRVARASIRTDVVMEIDLESNVAFQVLAEGDEDPVVTAVTEEEEEIIPLNCSTAPAMSDLKARLAIFRRAPGGAPEGFSVNLPQGWHQMYLNQMRRAGDEHFVFPATNATCNTGICMVAADDPAAECQTLRETDPVVTLVRRDGNGLRVAGLVRDGVETVDATYGGATHEFIVDDNLFRFEVLGTDEFEVEAGS